MTEEPLKKLDFKKGKCLIPVVVQEFKSKDLLMLAYVNKEALKKTLETGYAHYWSRSRKKLWMKGETSGHTQKIKRILVDCDYDTLLYLVTQKGPACHTNKLTCFHNIIK
ncbi:MAG: phosphoribosyl-AMP cyclohydrolase [Candidatus Bathyarchaeota archaeon]|nr:phosphoribosyl-AMP cyclohydrolase [Candidatus Bathyarchaeota archaeon]